MAISARQINILRPNTSGTWTTLDAYMARKQIIAMPWSETQVITVSGVQFKLVDSTTHLSAGLLAVLTASPPTTLTTNGAICAAELAGAVGTAATTNHTDNLGNILNLVPIRDASTHDEIVVTVSDIERTVYALIQCANSVAEGTAIGAAASENTQLSFVYVAANGALTLTEVTGTIEFCVNKVYLESQKPDVMMLAGRHEELLVEPAALAPLMVKLVVTTAFTSGEVITIATGAGSGSGASTATFYPTGSTITLGAASTDFRDGNMYRVRLNGVQLTRGVEVEWESATTLSINYIMDVNDVIEIECPA